MPAVPLRSEPVGPVDAAPPVRIGLIEDHTLFRVGIRLVLTDAGFEIVGEADGAAEAVDMVGRAGPDIVLLDISLGTTDGMPLVRLLRERFPSTRILIVSMHRDPDTVRMAFQSGAAGFVVKGARASELIDAIRAVAQGERYIHSSVAGEIIESSLRSQPSGDVLTAREREILRQVARGRPASEIGRELGISEFTVRRHVVNLGQKLGRRGIRALRRYAAEMGL